jgi:hypothetical protein
VPVQTAVAVSAFAAVVDLGKLQQLLAEFDAARIAVQFDDLLVRAAALALETLAGGTSTTAGDTTLAIPLVVAWETGGAAVRREIVLTDAHKGPIRALHDRLAAASAEPVQLPRARPGSGLSLRRLGQTGIRPTAMPLLPGHAMRLVVSAADSATSAECLLCFDARAVSEDVAAAFLARFRDVLEMPLGLLA